MKEKLSVLLVDDEDMVLKYLSTHLSSFGDLDVICAMSFQEAKRVIEAVHPRITIADIGLPDGNGLDLVGPAKKYSPINQVIIMTGTGDIVRMVDALELGVMDYLLKPIDAGLLKRIIAEALDRCRRWESLMELAGLEPHA